jgi:predicted GNAT family N-acyltransferase
VSIEVHTVKTKTELSEIFEIRNKVFVIEQKVDRELEYDEFEETSTHYIAHYNDKPVGTARWRKTSNGIKLERFAVLSDYRSKGVGSALVDKVLSDLPPTNQVYLHAQLTAIPLYKKHGFVEVGPQFEEANIQHFKMVLQA